VETEIHRIKNAFNTPTYAIFPTLLVFHYRLPLTFNYPDILGEGLDVFGPEEFSLLWRGLGGGQT
jgi:hypothetical protein